MLRSVLMLAALVAAPALAHQSTPQPSLVRESDTEKLTSHIWAIPDGGAS